MLDRLGNKQRLSEIIIGLFPPHSTYIELFLGSGSIFFDKPLSSYNVLNDIDEDVYNLFVVVKERHNELIELLEQVPYHTSIFEYFKLSDERDPIWKALRMIYLSNFSMYSTGNTLRLNNNNKKELATFGIYKAMQRLSQGGVAITNKDYKDFFKVLGRVNDVFVYADPPYIDTKNTYGNMTGKWIIDDFINLVDVLLETGYKFAISEFDDSRIIEVASNNNLNIIDLGERQNVRNIRREILITNYTQDTLF